MKFEFYYIGKTTERYLIPALEHYQAKLGHYMNSEIKIVPASPEKNKLKALGLEAGKILNAISSHDFLVVLDERGKQLTSVELAGEIQKVMNQSWSKIVFVIGGPFGIGEDLKMRANLVLSFSKFTFTHQMIRLILAEQVYRSMTILKGEAYHHQ